MAKAQKGGRKRRRVDEVSIYGQLEVQAIAAAVSRPPNKVLRVRHLFEAAGMWYRLDVRGQGLRRAPSLQIRKLRAVSSAALELLRRLGVERANEAIDGPTEELLEMLSWLDRDLDAVAACMGRIGRLIETMDGLAATMEIRRRAAHAAIERVKLRNLTERPGHGGDAALNDWVAGMMPIYEMLTGSCPRTSVASSTQPNAGKATGPFIRFLTAAALPIGVRKSPDAWRARVRAISRAKSQQTRKRSRHVDLTAS
jgi:hypothetical protein